MAGLDISASSVKLVELTQGRPGSFSLELCAIEPLERGWITDGNIEKFDEVVEAVRRVVRKSGTKAKRVSMINLFFCCFYLIFRHITKVIIYSLYQNMRCS